MPAAIAATALQIGCGVIWRARILASLVYSIDDSIKARCERWRHRRDGWRKSNECKCEDKRKCPCEYHEVE